tara:strand:- start:790 stop:999 length:210 start_codon:yes stop_codon:yes gene_type:complete
MAPRPYYTVIEKLAGESWTPQFGSFYKVDCKEEISSMSNDALIFTKFGIMTSGHTQAEINKAVSLMNQA